MSVKLQINSLQALERLIGGDSELEFEIRQSVVENFTKKHLTTIANSELIKNASAAVKTEIHRTFFDTVISGSGWNSSEQIVFKKEYLDNLKYELTYSAKQTLNKVVEDVIEEAKTKEKIEAALDTAANYIVNTLTESNLTARLNRMVDAKLKERLGL